MALGTLSFRSRGAGVTAEELPIGICVRGEVEWVVAGPVAEIAALLAAVETPFAERVSQEVALLRFGNAVGNFQVAALGTLVVKCGKWDESTFDALLEELTEVALALPYAADQGAGHPYDRMLVANNAILLHAFLYARQLLLGSNRETDIAAAIAAVTADPHRLLVAQRERTELAHAQYVDARSIERLVAGAEPFEPARGPMALQRLAQQLRGHVPSHVDTPRLFNSLDTAENRFVLAFLEQLSEVIARVEALAREKRKANAFWQRVESDCDRMRKKLQPMRRHALWDQVGRLTHLPGGSSVLQRRRGYRDLLRHHLLLRAAARLPFDERLSLLLGMKDVAALYEVWCFFAVVRAMTSALGRAPDQAERFRVSAVQLDVPWGMRVAWGNEVAVYYNLTFSRAQYGMRRSVSLQLRPDISIQVRAEGRDSMHVLDAKLRLERAGSPADAEPTGSSSFKWEDIAKMHAYRDALPAVRTAFVLYPGDEFECFPIDGTESGSVGAIPLVPGCGDHQLSLHLRRAVLGST